MSSEIAAPSGHRLGAAAQLLPAELIEPLNCFFQAAEGALAKRTLDALRSDGRLFATWCQARSAIWLPAAPPTVAAFVRDIGQSRRPATVRRYLASIAMWHAAVELPSPCATMAVRLALRALANQKSVRQAQAKPLGEAEIDVMVQAMAPATLAGAPDLYALRDRALILTARDTLARASELVGILWEDLERDAEGGGTILIRRSKTDPEGRGAPRYLAPDAIRALDDWRAAITIAINPATKKIVAPSPLIFRHLSRRGFGPALTTTSVSRIVKRRAGDIGLLLAGYSAHSTRVGAAQDLLAAGEDVLAVMQAGGWKSASMPARYGERLLASRGAVARVRRRR